MSRSNDSFLEENSALANLQCRLENLTSILNIRKWDLGAATSVDNSVQIDKGEAKQLKGSQRSSITVRVWNSDGVLGITSTTDLSDNGLRKALEGAQQASFFGNSKDIPNFSPLANSPLPNIKRDIKPLQGIAYLLTTLKDAESKLLSSHKSIESIPYNGLAESQISRVYINSEGCHRRIDRSQASLYLYARAEELNRKPRSSGAIRLALGSADLDIEGCIDEAANGTISHLNYESIETGKYLVCFTPEAFLELLGAFSSLFNARSIIDGLSLSNIHSLGKPIAVPFLNLNDNGLHPSNITSSTFDGEGTPTQNISLINGGILEGLIHSEATAKVFKTSPTGHAGLGAKVSVSPDWLEISKTNSCTSPNEHLNHKTTKDSYVLIEGLNALHAGVKASQGSFSLPFDGWLVKDGERVSIEAATIAGDILDVLTTIVQLEDDQIITHQGVSPHVWVDNLSITGEA